MHKLAIAVANAVANDNLTTLTAFIRDGFGVDTRLEYVSFVCCQAVESLHGWHLVCWNEAIFAWRTSAC